MINIEIDYKSKEIGLCLSKDFYSVDAVKQAIEDFKGICDSSLSNKKDILISLKLKTDEDINIVGYEFCNYVLALMKNEAIV